MELMLMDSLVEAEAKSKAMGEPLCVQVGEARYRVMPNGESFVMENGAPTINADGEATSRLDQVETKVLHNFDGDARRLWELESLAESNDTLNADKLGNDTFEVRYYYMKEATVMDAETGELVETIRTALISPDNKVAAFSSEGVARSVARMIKHFPEGPIEPPLKVKVQVTKTGGKKRFITLMPAVLSKPK